MVAGTQPMHLILLRQIWKSWQIKSKEKSFKNTRFYWIEQELISLKRQNQNKKNSWNSVSIKNVMMKDWWRSIKHKISLDRLFDEWQAMTNHYKMRCDPLQQELKRSKEAHSKREAKPCYCYTSTMYSSIHSWFFINDWYKWLYIAFKEGENSKPHSSRWL